MTRIAFSSSFKRAFRKRMRKDTEFEAKFWRRVESFLADSFSPGLRAHKLSGNLKDLWSFSIDSDLRVIFYFEGDLAVFIDLGTHDEVY
jgi:addiction module RelE/StbE family toxin